MADASGGFARNVFDLVWIEGPDAVSFLDGILSQDLDAMAPGSTARTFLLQPQGKLRHLMWAMRGEDRLGLLVDAGRGAMLAEDLGYYRIRVKAQVRLDDRPVHLAWSGFESSGSTWQESDGELTGQLVGRGIPRRFTTGSNDDAPLSGAEATRWRVLAGEPVMDVDVDESTIPQETGLVDEAVSFTKGCYLGQELVARIDTRGRVNRQLVGLRLEDGVTPTDGTQLMVDDAVVGSLTSAVADRSSNAVVALAKVRREVDVGATVMVESTEGPGVVEALPFEGF